MNVIILLGWIVFIALILLFAFTFLTMVEWDKHYTQMIDYMHMIICVVLLVLLFVVGHYWLQIALRTFGFAIITLIFLALLLVPFFLIPFFWKESGPNRSFDCFIVLWLVAAEITLLITLFIVGHFWLKFPFLEPVIPQLLVWYHTPHIRRITLAVLTISILVVILLLIRRRLGRLFKKWGNELKEKKIERLTTRAADIKEDTPYDLIFLHEKGFVRAKGTGQDITMIYAVVENLIRKMLKIVVTPGTYFVSSGVHQNMVTRKEYAFELYPCSKLNLGIQAACINANSPIPGKKDRFYGVKRVSDDLTRFLEATSNSEPMVVQAGVWALTDGYSGHDVQTKLVVQDQFGNKRPAVSWAQIAEARSILNRLGIRHNL